jgi:hypothetical protein
MYMQRNRSSAQLLSVFQRNSLQPPHGTLFVPAVLTLSIGIVVAVLGSCGGSTPNSSIAKTPPTITTSSLPSGTAFTPYQQTTLAATGGTPPYTWSLTSAPDTFPGGLSLSSTGNITGMPTTPLAYDFTVQATDSANLSANASLSITINSGALIASPSALNFSTTSAQSFILEGGSGVTNPPSENCSASGIATLTPPPQGFPPFNGTWNVSPLGNGACNVTFTDGITLSTTAVNINVDIQPGTSTLTFQMEENSDCNNVTIWFRFFDETDNLIWPAPPNAYYFPYSNQVYTQPLSCTSGANVCYGASFYTNTEQPEYWGVGINNDEPASTNSCFTCDNGTTIVNDLSCSSTPSLRRREKRSIPLHAPMGRGPESEIK